MADTTDALTKGKIGPLPTPVAIGLGLGGVYYLYTRYKSNQAAATAAATPVQATDPYGTSTAPPLTDSNTSTDSGTSTSITTNQQWATAAEVWLLAQGYNPTLVDGAVRDYLAGNQLDTNEQAVVNQALEKFGPLPDPLPPTGPPPTVPPPVPPPKTPIPPPPKKPPVPAPPPPKKTPPPPSTPTEYTIQRGDTLSGIAQRFYGNALKWPLLYNYNRAHGKLGPNPNYIQAGWVMLLPPKGTNGL